MAKKRAPKMMPAAPAETKLVPVRFMMPPKAYEELARQAERIGLSNSSYAKMLVMKGVMAEKEGGAK
jgi:hypothetical protein